MKHRVGLTFGRGCMVVGRRQAAASSAPTVTNFSVVSVTQTAVTLTWTCDQYVTGQVRYGTSQTNLNMTSTLESSFDYQTHVQTVSDLSIGTVYYFQAFGQNAYGDGYASNIVAVTTTGGTSSVTYTDYVLPTSWAGYAIDHTGTNDSTPGINAWVQAHAGGTDETNHVRLIFPGGSRLKINSPICVDETMSHTTFWAHATTLNDGSDPDSYTSSAWIRGDASSYPDVGCVLDPAHITTGTPRHVVFLLGARYNGYENLSYMREVQDIVIRGFDIDGNWASDTFSEKPAGVFYAMTVQDFEILYNRSDNQSGDFIRFRAAARGHVHHNYGKRMGRMAVTCTINYYWDVGMRSDHLVEYNTFDRCNYWGLDIEPEDEADTSRHNFVGLIMRNNRFGCFGGNLGGGFFVIGGTSTPSNTRHIADIEIRDNVIDGYDYNANSTTESMWMLIAHTTNLSAVPPGSDPRPQNVVISGNTQTPSPYSAPYAAVLTARYTDGLTITNNDANYAGSDWAVLTGCTGVTESGNT